MTTLFNPCLAFFVTWAPSVPCPECTGVWSITWSQGDCSVCMCCKCTGTVESSCMFIFVEVWERYRGKSRSGSRKRWRWWSLVLMPWKWFRVETTEQHTKLLQFSPTGPVGGLWWVKEKIRSTRGFVRGMKQQFKRFGFKSSLACLYSITSIKRLDACACVGINQVISASVYTILDFRGLNCFTV